MVFLDINQIVRIGEEFLKKNDDIITCEAYVNKLPKTRKFLVMAGTKEIRDFLYGFKFSKEDIKQLKEIRQLKRIFSSSNFEKFLEEFRFQGTFKSMAEGEIVFAGEPLIQITGNIIETLIAEFFVVSLLNCQVNITSKSARIILASRNRPVYENIKYNNFTSKCAYLAGFRGTLSINKLGIPLFDCPDCIFVETNDGKTGIQNSNRRGELSILLNNIRNDLDKEEFYRTSIAVVGNLDEHIIDNLARSGLSIDLFIVGNSLISNDINVEYSIVYSETNKISIFKSIIPGKKQVFLDQRKGGWSHLVALDGVIKETEDLVPLLDCHIKNGIIQEDNIVDLEVSRKYCNSGLANLYPELSSLKLEEIKVPVYPDDSIKQIFKEYYNGLDME